jgi:hypothetical protein
LHLSITTTFKLSATTTTATTTTATTTAATTTATTTTATTTATTTTATTTTATTTTATTTTATTTTATTISGFVFRFDSRSRFRLGRHHLRHESRCGNNQSYDEISNSNKLERSKY